MTAYKRGTRPINVVNAGEAPAGSFFYNAPAHVVVCSPYFKADNKTITSQQRKSRSRAKK